MPNSDCNGANDTEACVVCVRPGLWRRWILDSYLDGLPYPLSEATPWPRPVACPGRFRMLGSPPSVGTGLPCAMAVGTATPAAAAAKAPRMKSRRPFLPSANTVRMPSWFRKFSGALRTLPEWMLSSFTQTPEVAFSYRRCHFCLRSHTDQISVFVRAAHLISAITDVKDKKSN